MSVKLRKNEHIFLIGFAEIQNYHQYTSFPGIFFKHKNHKIKIFTKVQIWLFENV